MGFIDHFLIVIRRKELDFAALPFNGAVHDLPGIGIGAHAAGDVRCDLHSSFHDPGGRHKIDIVQKIIFFQKVHNLLEFICRIFFFRRTEIFDVQIDDGLAGEFCQHFFKGGDLQAFEAFVETAAEVQRFQFSKRLVLNQPGAVGHPVKAVIMADDRDAVGGEAHIQFDFFRPKGDSGTESGQGVFGRNGIEAPVCADPGIGQGAFRFDHRAAAGPVCPRRSALTDEFIVGDHTAAETVGPHELVVNIPDLAGEQPQFVAELAQNRSFRCDRH